MEVLIAKSITMTKRYGARVSLFLTFQYQLREIESYLPLKLTMQYKLLAWHPCCSFFSYYSHNLSIHQNHIPRLRCMPAVLLAIQYMYVHLMIRFCYILLFHNVDDSATARTHAVSFVQSIRAWSNRIFATGLSNQRNVEERKKILDELYCRLVDEVAKAPADRGCSRVDNFVIVAKTGEV